MSVNHSDKTMPDHIAEVPAPVDIPALLAMIRATGVASDTKSADILREMRDTRYGELCRDDAS